LGEIIEVEEVGISAGAALATEDGVLAVVTLVGIQEGAKCLVPSAAIVAKSVKYLSGLQVASRFTAAIVLKK
jgi:hypothetical protein